MGQKEPEWDDPQPYSQVANPNQSNEQIGETVFEHANNGSDAVPGRRAKNGPGPNSF